MPASISLLPPELLSLIFEVGVWSDPFPDRFAAWHRVTDGSDPSFDRRTPLLHHYDPEFRMTVGQVSKTWKSVRDATPRLWTRIEVVYDTVGKAPPQTLMWLLKRSGALPLDIRLACASSERSSETTFDSLSRSWIILTQALTQVLGILQHSIPRWRSFHLTARTRSEAYSTLVQFRQPALQLEELRITAQDMGATVQALTSRAHFPPLPPLFGSRTPKLRSVVLEPFAVNIDIQMMTNLRSIRLDGGWVTQSQLLRALGANRGLEELSLVTVDFQDALWSAYQEVGPDINIVLPCLHTLKLEAPRSSMVSLLSRLTVPSLTSLALCRTEEFDEDVDEEEAVAPSTAAVLRILANARRAGHLPLRFFSLTYGSVWEANAEQGEEGTNDALTAFLGLVDSLETLKVHNYSHHPSTLLQVGSEPLRPDENDIPVCPALRHLHISQCEGTQRGAVRRFVESRLHGLGDDQAISSPCRFAELDSLVIEAESGKVVCGLDDIRWIKARVPHFRVDQSSAMVHSRWIDYDDED
ncbi:hypothetical protein BS47DRAFT_1482428 [Hydnum rufescens UP504]|uniref:F-box domain-containing protein n=1 Tax=Hydnum rufescens UP504 TaxID=1448309 RepID=A0A9P6B6V7_9AGAM|nr:hypothetical protein BS47DRAFT_1482428 [Hydnum rufescens UP504]